MFFFCPQKSVFLDGYRKETRRGSLGLLPASIRKKRRHSTYIYTVLCVKLLILGRLTSPVVVVVEWSGA
jgi:hypothetical protein